MNCEYLPFSSSHIETAYDEFILVSSRTQKFSRTRQKLLFCLQIHLKRCDMHTHMKFCYRCPYKTWNNCSTCYLPFIFQTQIHAHTHIFVIIVQIKQWELKINEMISWMKCKNGWASVVWSRLYLPGMAWMNFKITTRRRVW